MARSRVDVRGRRPTKGPSGVFWRAGVRQSPQLADAVVTPFACLPPKYRMRPVLLRSDLLILDVSQQTPTFRRINGMLACSSLAPASRWRGRVTAHFPQKANRMDRVD